MKNSKNRPRKRNREISIRLTDDEHKALNDRKTDATLAGWMRNLGLGVTPIKQADPDLVRALGRIGSNLNQVARHANIEEKLDKDVLTEILAIRKALNELIEQNLQRDPTDAG